MKGSVAVRRLVGTPIGNACASNTIASGSYTQLAASTAAACSAIVVSNTSAKMIKIATGGAGSEVDICQIAPGVLEMFLPHEIAKATRISAKADADAVTGYFTINFLA